MTNFRFENLEIWKKAVEIGNALFDIADALEGKKLFRFADQLRGAGLSMSNNIAEGSGSLHSTEFYNYLNIARRSVFENANMLIVFNQRQLIAESDIQRILSDLESLSKMITGFQKSLKKDRK